MLSGTVALLALLNVDFEVPVREALAPVPTLIYLIFSAMAPQLHRAGMSSLSGFSLAPFSRINAFKAVIYLPFSTLLFY